MHRIITGDENWIYYENPKRFKAWIKPCETGSLSPKCDIHCSKVMLCIWWDQKDIVFYELLQPDKTVNAPLYKEQLTQLSLELQHKRPEYAKRHEKVIFQKNNATPHVAKLVKEKLETLGWEVLTHHIHQISLLQNTICSDRCSQSSQERSSVNL